MISAAPESHIPNRATDVSPISHEIPSVTKIDISARAITIDRDGKTIKLVKADDIWTAQGSYPEHDKKSRAFLTNLRENNPGKLALLVIAASQMIPSRLIEELSAKEGNALLSALKIYTSSNSEKVAELALANEALSALEKAFESPSFKAAEARETASEETKLLDIPLRGSCELTLLIGGKSKFSFIFEEGKVKDIDSLTAEARHLRIRAVEHSNVLTAEMKAYLLSELTPKVVIEDGVVQIAMAIANPAHLVNIGTVGKPGIFRFSIKDGSISVKQSESKEWSPSVSPSEILLALRALEDNFPVEYKELKSVVFRKYNHTDGKGQYYGHFQNACNDVGIYIPHGNYPATDFYAKRHGCYRWSDADGGAAFAIRAISEICADRGEDIGQPLSAVLSLDTRRRRPEDIIEIWSYTESSSDIRLRDLRNEGSDVTARYSPLDVTFQWMNPGYHASSGYAYQKAGWSTPPNEILGAFLELSTFVAKRAGTPNLLSSAATIHLPNGEEIFAYRHSGDASAPVVSLDQPE